MLRIPLLADHEYNRLLCRRHHNGPWRAPDLALQTEPGGGDGLKTRTERGLTRLYNWKPTRRDNPAGEGRLSPNKKAKPATRSCRHIGMKGVYMGPETTSQVNAGTSEAEKEVPAG